MKTGMTGSVGGSTGGTDLHSAVDLLQKKVDALQERLSMTTSKQKGELLETSLMYVNGKVAELAGKQEADVADLRAEFKAVDERALRQLALDYATRTCSGPISNVIHTAKAFMEWIKNG